MRLLSVSIDLDEIACYTAIHGVAQGADCHAVYDIALGRIRDFAASVGVPLTLFVVARDLERESNRSVLKDAVSDGHEIGNHSLDHLYDLTRRPMSEQKRQVVEASARIEALLGVRPAGFRAPGYTMTDALMAELSQAGFRYDSSVFPCPPYYAAKAIALFGMKLRRRTSNAILGRPDVLRAPTRPYATGAHYWLHGSGLLELPIQVVGPLRLPFIGTSLTLLGPSAARLFTRQLVGVPFVNLELHGMDFLEAADVPRSLQGLQPDLSVPVARKLKALTATLHTLLNRGYEARRLDEVARTFADASERWQ